MMMKELIERWRERQETVERCGKELSDLECLTEGTISAMHRQAAVYSQCAGELERMLEQGESNSQSKGEGHGNDDDKDIPRDGEGAR